MAITQKHVDKVFECVEHEGNPVLKLAPIMAGVPGIPADWTKVLSKSDASAEVLKVLWQPMARRFARTLRELKRCLQGVGLLTTDARPPSIIYFLTSEQNNPFFYRGFVPVAKLPSQAKSLPEEFTKFYQIHDGWIDRFQSVGPRPSRDWDFLGEDPNEPAGKFLVVFDGHAGDRLGYDLGQSPPLCYVLASGDPPPRVIPRIWTEIDKWVAIRLENNIPYASK